MFGARQRGAARDSRETRDFESVETESLALRLRRRGRECSVRAPRVDHIDHVANVRDVIEPTARRGTRAVRMIIIYIESSMVFFPPPCPSRSAAARGRSRGAGDCHGGCQSQLSGPVRENVQEQNRTAVRVTQDPTESHTHTRHTWPHTTHRRSLFAPHAVRVVAPGSRETALFCLHRP